MEFKTVKLFFWTTFVLSIAILFLNLGLGLIAFGIILLPVFILHFAIGLSLDRIQKHRTAIILSSLNLLTFVLIRPDGVHAFTESGLSSILNIFGVNARYSRQYEDYFFSASLVLLLLQLIIDLRLRKFARRN